MAILNKIPTKELEKFSIVNETLILDVKENPKDKITIEIGDSKQPDFKPQVKISRWDNEINLSVRAEEHPSATVEYEKDKVKYITPDYEVHQFEKPEAGEDGGFEFEWLLPKKPETNVLTATIQTKGLDFFYQPELTQEEIEEGAERPENVVGSYAVYHKTKGKMNDIAGMEYKTGKAFHIYRPKAVDKNGVEQWCDLNITEDILTVTVPQSFLDTAVYPVIVDPTFGITGVGGTSWVAGINTVRGWEHSPASSGTLDSISIYVVNSSAGNIQMAVYENVETSSTRIDYTGSGTIPTSAGWVTNNVIVGGSVVGSTVYIIAENNDTSGTNVYYDTGTRDTDYFEATFGTWGTSIDWILFPWLTNRDVSIYATYTASAGSTSIPDVRLFFQ